ncbi:hypothetical protein evm_002257 [Chilo suppressalis]|nr:hypothetical protein evm_002257 [Chilo suppressalis]
MYNKSGSVLTSIPETSEEEEVKKWVPKKKHDVLKAKYKCLKKLFQVYDASVIGILPEPCAAETEYRDVDDSSSRSRCRRKRSHRTKTDACAGTTELTSGDVTEVEDIGKLSIITIYRGARWRKWLARSAAIVEVKQLSQWSVIGWVTKKLLSRAPPCFGRHVKPLVPAASAVVSTHQSALGPRGGRQLSLHVDLEHRVHDKFSKFHSCAGITNTRRRCDLITEDGKINFKSEDIRDKELRRKSEESLTYVPSTNIVCYTSMESVNSKVPMGYKWEPGTKIIRKRASGLPHNKCSMLPMDTCSTKGHSCVAGSERKGSSAFLRLAYHSYKKKILRKVRSRSCWYTKERNTWCSNARRPDDGRETSLRCVEL